MKIRYIMIILLSAILISCVLTGYSSADDDCYLRISSVYPTSSSEGFALTNYGSDTVDLIDYRMSDGEGTVTFTESIIISPQEKLYVLKGEPPVWLNDIRYMLYGNNGIKVKNFTLSDSGDDLYLYRGETLIDTFVYGNITDSKSGWNGNPVDKIPKNKIAERTSYTDTDTSADWTITNHLVLHDIPAAAFDAYVTPFAFPESKGEPILSELSSAVSSVDISVYLINHPAVISALDHLLSSGVAIRILVEGSPVGGIGDDELGLLTALYKHGAEIRMIHSGDNGKRYNYLHNKYAIIDQKSVIITTENWQKTSFESNRGWGAIIDSIDYAQYMLQIFNDDYSGYDTDDIRDLYPKIKPYSIDDYIPVSADYQSFKCSVMPVLSPDNSLDCMKAFIDSAEEYIFIQQLEIESDWLDEDDNPLAWVMERSFEGVDCRLMISSAFDDTSDGDNDAEYLQDELTNYDLSCKLYEGSGLLHNKSLITENKVWLGSVNWTNNSFGYNRETAVIIESSEVSDFFRTYFISDWGDEYSDYTEIKVDYDSIVVSGDTVLLDASDTVTGSNAVFQWDLDSDGVFERTGKRIPVIFPTGQNNVCLRVVNGDETEEMNFEVCSIERTQTFEIPWKYVPFILLCIIIIIAGVIKRDRNDS